MLLLLFSIQTSSFHLDLSGLAHGAALLGFLRLVHRRRFLRPGEVRTALVEVAEPAPGQAAGLADAGPIARCGNLEGKNRREQQIK